MLDGYTERYADMQRKHMAFFQLKMVLGPCIETLILFDRLAYLLEQAMLCCFLLIVVIATINNVFNCFYNHWATCAIVLSLACNVYYQAGYFV